MAEKLIMLDTNLLVGVFRNQDRAIQLLEQYSQEKFCLNPITKGEFLYGARNTKEFQNILQKLNAFPELTLSRKSSVYFSSIIEQHTISRHIKIPDALIAAICLAYEVPLLTLNQKDFNFIEGLILLQ
ncbi:MAG TPA: pilus assembly protein [Cytophagales bacterium]|nr:pilus assembly protein [Cytophagales bacterium]HAA24143.1 pilus assembly protein [Cytophagales bacterium]